MLLNISRSKGNWTIKFGQLVEYNMRNIFLENSYTKYGGETIPRPVYSGHVTYAFHSESTLYSCLNVKELLARSRREI